MAKTLKRLSVRPPPLPPRPAPRMVLTEPEKETVRTLDINLTLAKNQIASIAVEIARLEQLEAAAIGKLLDTQREAEAYVVAIVTRLGRDPAIETWDLDATTMLLTRRV